MNKILLLLFLFIGCADDEPVWRKSTMRIIKVATATGGWSTTSNRTHVREMATGEIISFLGILGAEGEIITCTIGHNWNYGWRARNCQVEK